MLYYYTMIIFKDKKNVINFLEENYLQAFMRRFILQAFSRLIY